MKVLTKAALSGMLAGLAVYIPELEDGSGALLGGMAAFVGVAIGLAAVERVRPGEAAGAAPVIVNISFVEQILGGRNAVGQRFRRETAEDSPAWFEIIGVVGPFGMNPINPNDDAGWYEPFVPGYSNPARYLVEVSGDPAAFASRLREIVAVAFLLAVSGLYALMSFTVSQRTREVAIRNALGAQPWSIVTTIGRRAALQLGIGLALGGVWAWVLLSQEADEPLIQSINVPLTIVVTLVVTAIVGAIGCASPTIRGLRIQPSGAMRESQ